MLAVFIASAVWHGPEAGFSVFFFTLFMNAIIAKFFEKTMLAQAIMVIVPWPVLLVPLWIWNYFQLSFGGMAFRFLTIRKFNHMHAAFGYCLFWVQPLLLLIAIALPKVKTRNPGVEVSTQQLKVAPIASQITLGSTETKKM